MSVSRRRIRHDADCHYLRSHPTEGDEAATCSCGAYAEGYEIWSLEQQLAGAVDAERERIAALADQWCAASFSAEAADAFAFVAAMLRDPATKRGQ